MDYPSRPAPHLFAVVDARILKPNPQAHGYTPEREPRPPGCHQRACAERGAGGRGRCAVGAGGGWGVWGGGRGWPTDLTGCPHGQPVRSTAQSHPATAPPRPGRVGSSGAGRHTRHAPWRARRGDAPAPGRRPQAHDCGQGQVRSVSSSIRRATTLRAPLLQHPLQLPR